MKESFRYNDMKAEEQLAEFMDKYFYSRLHDQNSQSVIYERKHDKEGQLKGVDVELKINEKTIYIDEKASLYYSNTMLPTFAFEIDSIQKYHEKPVLGWFLNDELITEYYMLIWPNVKCRQSGNTWVRKDIRELQVSDFTIVEAMLIDKKQLTIELGKMGCERTWLLEYAKRLREKMVGREEYVTEPINENVKITYTGTLAEKPINAVVRKSFLKSIAKAIYLISEDGYARVK